MCPMLVHSAVREARDRAWDERKYTNAPDTRWFTLNWEKRHIAHCADRTVTIMPPGATLACRAGSKGG
jgi:hypothetical protein